jgi:hypothetical protein
MNLGPWRRLTFRSFVIVNLNACCVNENVFVELLPITLGGDVFGLGLFLLLVDDGAQASLVLD